MWRTTLICLFAIASRESFGTKQVDPKEFQNIRGITGGNKICTVKGIIHGYLHLYEEITWFYKLKFFQLSSGNMW